jgi:Ycf66 protein N-terminus
MGLNIVGSPLMALLAIVAALGGVGLYFVRNFRPELARDHDIFFSAIALVYGIVLLFFNFRMDSNTQLAQALIVSFAGWFAIETLVLRQALSTQARRTTQPMGPIMDEEPIRPDYRVELDPSREISPRRSRDTRRMRGTGTSAPRPTELRGDVGQDRPNRRAKRDFDSGVDSVIDIDDDDIRRQLRLA